MTIEKYRKQWLRQHKAYEKLAYKKFVEGFKSLGNSIPFYFMTIENYNEILNTNFKQELFFNIYYDVYKEVGIAHGERIRRQINTQVKDFTLSAFISEFERTLLTWLFNNAVERVTTVRKTYLDFLRMLIAEQVEQGKTMSQIASEIQTKVNQRDFYRYQALRIARTETTAAANHATMVASDNSRFELNKVWISAVDSRTRRPPKAEFNHVAINGTIVEKEKPFQVPKVGGFENLMFPGDPKGSAGNVINCRCTIALVPRKDENGNLVRKRNYDNNISIPFNNINPIQKPIINNVNIQSIGTEKLSFDVNKYSIEKANEYGLKGDIKITYNLNSKKLGGGTGWRKDSNGNYESNLQLNIYGKLTDEQIKQVINHELKHIEQIQKKRFEFKGGFYYWNGKAHISSNTYKKYINMMSSAKTNQKKLEYYKKYMELPWELEAHRAGDAFNGLERMGLKSNKFNIVTDIITPIEWDKEIPYKELTELDKEELKTPTII